MVTQRDKIEDFKYSSLSVVKPPLATSFAPFATGIPTDLKDIEKAIQDAPGIVARAKENEQLMSDGSVDGLTARTGQLNEHQKKLLERIKAQGRADNGFNLLLLDALQNNTLPSFIADQVFDDMSDDDVTALVADIEDQTGRPFEAYAKDILGDDMPERNPGESEADYQRRVLKELTEEMLNPDGSVKAKYADDPLAQMIKRNATYQVIADAAQSRDAEMQAAKQSGDTAKQDALLQETDNAASGSFSEGKVVTEAMSDETLVEVASNAQDEHSDDKFDSDSANDESSFELASLGIGISAEPISPSFETAALGETDTPDLENRDTPAPLGTDPIKPI